MDKIAEVARVEREAVEVRLSPAELCRRAGINPSTWWRIRKEPKRLSLDTLAKIEVAIKARRAELEAA